MSPSFDIHESHHDLLSWMLESHRQLLKHNKTWEDSTREPERLRDLLQLDYDYAVVDEESFSQR